MKKSGLIILLLLQALTFSGQNAVRYSPEEQSRLLESMKAHVFLLASDSLNGRESGTKEELWAADYISGEFSNIGIPPLKGKDYLLPFTFNEGCSFTYGTIDVGAKSFEMDTHFFYLNQLVGYEFKGKIKFLGSGLYSSDYIGTDSTQNKSLVFVIDVNYSDTCAQCDNKDMYFDLVQQAVGLATARRPAGLILISSDEKKFPVYSDWKVKAMPPIIPVVGAGHKLSEYILENINDSLYSHNTFQTNARTGYNVAAMIDNGKPTTIVFGAHYDHLGRGGFSSRHNGPGEIHNGADDNASGTALLIELARRIRQQGYNSHNYLFIAFGAEEKGLLGSKAFLNQSHFEKSDMLAMLNFDMVGRADTLFPRLNIIGTGTASEWDSLLSLPGKHGLEVNRSPSGLGGSDQMSFYLQKIPVLFFITGMHKDYHQPGDDAEKINFRGMVSVLELTEELVLNLNQTSTMTFQETENQDSGRNKRPGVTLGLIPDHAWTGKGLRIDGITSGKTADKAGLKSGDVIITIGDQEVSDIMSYMNILSGYKKGDVAKIVYLRGQIESSVEVTF